MTLEERMELFLKNPGTYIAEMERDFIRNMRFAARHGVGYGWMQQVIEWEWQSKDPKGAWGPEYYERERAALADQCVSDTDVAEWHHHRDLLLARINQLETVLGALGVIGNGYCFCSKDRNPSKSEHQPECRDARAALAGESK